MTREAAISWFKARLQGGILPGAREAFNAVLKVLTKDDWIPCSERLPEEEEDVLATISGEYKSLTFDHAVVLAWYSHDDDRWYVPDYEGFFSSVLAWMPLPEPYHERGET